MGVASFFNGKSFHAGRHGTIEDVEKRLRKTRHFSSHDPETWNDRIENLFKGAAAALRAGQPEKIHFLLTAQLDDTEKTQNNPWPNASYLIRMIETGALTEDDLDIAVAKLTADEKPAMLYATLYFLSLWKIAAAPVFEKLLELGAEVNRDSLSWTPRIDWQYSQNSVASCPLIEATQGADTKQEILIEDLIALLYRKGGADIPAAVKMARNNIDPENPYNNYRWEKSIRTLRKSYLSLTGKKLQEPAEEKRSAPPAGKANKGLNL